MFKFTVLVTKSITGKRQDWGWGLNMFIKTRDKTKNNLYFSDRRQTQLFEQARAGQQQNTADLYHEIENLKLKIKQMEKG